MNLAICENMDQPRGYYAKTEKYKYCKISLTYGTQRTHEQI